jgi:hypothetical protein
MISKIETHSIQPYPCRSLCVTKNKGEYNMKRIAILFFILVMVFALTIPASANGNGPANNNFPGGIDQGKGTGPENGHDPKAGNISKGNNSGGNIDQEVGTGPVLDPGPCGGNGAGGKGSANNQGRQGPRINFTINGEIAAIGTDTVTISVICGNKTAQVYIGSQVTVTVTPLTRFHSEIGTIDFPVQFSDLQVGQLVSLNGTVVESVWKVRRITIVTALDCLP